MHIGRLFQFIILVVISATVIDGAELTRKIHSETKYYFEVNDCVNRDGCRTKLLKKVEKNEYDAEGRQTKSAIFSPDNQMLSETSCSYDDSKQECKLTQKGKPMEIEIRYSLANGSVKIFELYQKNELRALDVEFLNEKQGGTFSTFFDSIAKRYSFVKKEVFPDGERRISKFDYSLEHAKFLLVFQRRQWTDKSELTVFKEDGAVLSRTRNYKIAANITGTSHHGPDDKLLRKIIFQRDEQGRLVRSESYNQKSELIETKIYTYADGLLIFEETRNVAGDIRGQITHKYDADRNKIEQRTTGADKNELIEI